MNKTHSQRPLSVEPRFLCSRLAWAAVFSLLAALLAPQEAHAQSESAPASDIQYMEAIEETDTLGGEDAVVDSMDQVVEQAEAGESLTGISPAREARIEEIVVSARKRAELLEDTPVSITALGAQVLRESGINRLDGIQELVPK